MTQIDWLQLPESFNWVAMDDNGEFHAFTEKPVPDEISKKWIPSYFGCRLIGWFGYYGQDWRETLTRRPGHSDAICVGS
jgi:hypothetical protein